MVCARMLIHACYYALFFVDIDYYVPLKDMCLVAAHS